MTKRKSKSRGKIQETCITFSKHLRNEVKERALKEGKNTSQWVSEVSKE